MPDSATPALGDRREVAAPPIETVSTLLAAASRAGLALESKINEANGEIRGLTEAGFLRDGYCAEGELLQQMPYSDGEAARHSNLAIQAYLVVPDGIGVVRWDSDTLQERWVYRSTDTSDVLTQFVPFEMCTEHERSLLGLHYESLIEGLYNSFGISIAVRAAMASSLPRWDGTHLLLGLTVIRTIPSRAKNLRLVLDAFQSTGWLESIKDPLNNQQLRHRTIQKLNENLQAIRFHGRDNRICWSRLNG